MDMVRVDPSLFIMCRLCLEETGMYQITPVVQQQIKYCFDIDVNQFDGLPQLICGQCESILSDYFTKKRIFVGRQNALKAKIEVRKEVEGSFCPSPPHEAVSSSQQCDNADNVETNIRRKSISKPKKRKLRVISSSSSCSVHDGQDEIDSETEGTFENDCQTLATKKVHENKRSKPRRESWEEYYTKGYACKLCNKYLKYNGGVKNHVRRHANLISKYKDVIDRTCMVKLKKSDGKPNPTGSNNTVALNENRIIGPHKDNVYVVYKSKKELDTLRVFEENVENSQSEFDDGEEDEILGKGVNAKRRRLLSKSSTDTVVLNGDDEIEKKRAVLKSQKYIDKEIECINIDDSSNGSQQSDSLPINDKDSAPVKPKDVEAINNLIRVCQNKYVTRLQDLLEFDTKKASSKGPQLKHKLLSMGRKVINRQGLSCTGLLRFLESKNPEVKWVPKISSNKDMNFARITARLKGKNELAPDNLGWKKRHVSEENQIEILPKHNLSETYSSVNDSSNVGSESSIPTKIKIIPSKKTDVNSQEINLHEIHSVVATSKLNQITNESSVVTSLCEILPMREPQAESGCQPEEPLFQDFDTRLLNANPVANPKQLPKKFNNFDNKLHTQSIIDTVVQQNYLNSNENTHESHCTDGNQQADTELCMPIITSTTSLAGSSSGTQINSSIQTDILDKDSTSNIENTNGVERPAPRIKVKPFSELMSDRALKTLTHTSAPDNVWAPNITTTGLTMNITRVTSTAHVPIESAVAIPSTNPKMPTAAPINPHQTFVTLDTVELPNTKTNSPIKYFRRLLQVHNIILMDSQNIQLLPTPADCLIKFKLQFVRENVNHPVTLCLSVHCQDNMFSLGVKDPNQSYLHSINLDSLSANWQWEILKIYTVRQDVTDKMLQNAQKISQKVYDYTKTFLCLLKSINIVKADV